MEQLKREVIFEMSFPKTTLEQLDATDEEMEKFLAEHPQVKRHASFTLQEFRED